ncbi:hypothetical protein [Candidatus Aquiluna sp. UB-MaderosW2red]|nr:hypothetical protein [Candidatus Aquiluna sp. UB-MaderosW2red]
MCFHSARVGNAVGFGCEIRVYFLGAVLLLELRVLDKGHRVNGT